MIVLDASGSMNQADAPGPRIDAAKAAVANLVDALAAQTQVGLQVYGTGTGSTDAEKTAGCTDIRTLAPVGPLDAAAIKAQIGTVIASGYTPIGNALRAAADALPNEGPRSIVLVSDGEDTCAPPAPCDVARELKQQGIDLVVHTVGFKVDATAREQLSCIATATGGTYSDADDAAQLNTVLATKVDYAVTGYTLQGTAVTGAAQPSREAPLLTPGQYVDTLANGDTSITDSSGSMKYYTVPIRPGVRLYVSVTIVPPDALATEISGFGTDVDLLRGGLAELRGGLRTKRRGGQLRPTAGGDDRHRPGHRWHSISEELSATGCVDSSDPAVGHGLPGTGGAHRDRHPLRTCGRCIGGPTSGG